MTSPGEIAVVWRQGETSDRAATEATTRDGAQRQVLGGKSQGVEQRGERVWWSGRAAVEMGLVVFARWLACAS